MAEEQRHRDWWPATRFFTVALVYGGSAWLLAGMPAIPWTVAADGAGRILKTTFGLGILSMTLAYVYAVAMVWLLVLPFYFSVLLNDWFYDVSHWLLAGLLGAGSPRVLAGFSLGGEVALFGIFFYGVSEAIKLV